VALSEFPKGAIIVNV